MHPDQMRANLNLTRGFIVSEAVMMGLAPVMGRDKAHDVIYELVHDPASQGKNLAERLLQRKDVTQSMSEDEIRKFTDPSNYFGFAQMMVDRLLETPKA